MSNILNEITIEMGGEVRTLRYSMKASRKLIIDSQEQNEEWLKATLNSIDLTVYLIDLGLVDKPEGYSKDLLLDWMDAMPTADLDKAADFARQAMGFIIQREQAAGNQIIQMIPQKEIPVSAT